MQSGKCIISQQDTHTQSMGNIDKIFIPSFPDTLNVAKYRDGEGKGKRKKSMSVSICVGPFVILKWKMNNFAARYLYTVHG